ncbi:Concanavalin A-like lectin/glucanases superfamily protein [Neorhodopirellula lusitana]|uniref:Concanavalin A-like lectin/glucanases superfamily protein n=1 Tax=Neorhodopirellula lusitana TaxID=445327 RepID=A0ABY1QRF6_9BACT|nr:LamG domain-containing protein [Neorhodopirellula lusitana]SMP78295.1 Concanavalin A-like lectin/glucanases superfamily protein [Neorhodopirellula lusitana]
MKGPNMNPDNHRLQTLRTLIVKSQSESLSDAEIEELNTLVASENGAAEAAELIDQLCAFTDSGAKESLPMAEILSELFCADAAENVSAHQRNPITPRTVAAMGGAASQASPSRQAGEPARTGRTTPVSQTTHTDRWTKAYWWVGIAASHLLVASLAWSIAKPQTVSSFPSVEASPAKLPQLVSMTACVWRSSNDVVPAVGESIPAGEVLSLVEGIAELRIGEQTPGEAMVRIEGPASVFARGGDRLGLQNGTLTVKTLGTGSKAFSIETPFGEVVLDGQSSIGLVSQGSVDEVHLFKGRAMVDTNVPGASDSHFVLEEGDAVRFTRKAGTPIEIVKFEASFSSFASARSTGFDPLNIGQDYVDAVLASDPKVYWRFQELSGEGTQYIANEGSSPDMNAEMIGAPSWRQYGENRVVELGLSAAPTGFQSSKAWPPTPLENYSVELWVKPQLFHHGEVLCLYSPAQLPDGRYQHTMMLETTAQHYFTHRLTNSAPNRFRYMHRKLGDTQSLSATSLFADKEYESRAWQHIVAQKEGSHQKLWINGRLEAEHESPYPLNNHVKVLIGQIYPSSVYRKFVGQIDEVALYDRCLSLDEMRSHIKAANRLVVLNEED